VMARRAGTVTAVSPSAVRVDDLEYNLNVRGGDEEEAFNESQALLFPVVQTWQEPAVVVGETVTKRQVIGRGMTHIYFQANVWIFTALVFIIGIAMGIGKAAVYKYIPDYFPNDVGVVGGIVGVIGGLGGFVFPIIFGYLLDRMGLWTTTWMFLFGVTVACMAWLAVVVRQMSRQI